MQYIFDSSAIIAYLGKEPGADIVINVLADKNNECLIHAVNLCEVYYVYRRKLDKNGAENIINQVLNTGLKLLEDMSTVFWKEVGEIKSSNRIALADCFAAALAKQRNAEVITADRKEFSPLVNQNICRVKFIR